MTATVSESGTIFLENTMKQGKHYQVRDSDDPEYFLGEAARTKDGWVSVPKDLRPKIVWSGTTKLTRP